jgi:hypothetical protein
MINYSINKNFCNKNEAETIVKFCLDNGELFSYNPSESWDCRRIYDEDFKMKIITLLNEKYKNNEFSLWLSILIYIKTNLVN